MKRLVGLASAVIVILLLTVLRSAAATKERPNIVFILIDDLRWDSLSSTGHPYSKTPNIDRIGREGAIFQNAFCTTPLCSPSRGSFLTGQYVHTHRIISNNRADGIEQISHQLMTFPRILHESGYETGYIGKWHMGSDDSPRPGIDYWVSFKGQGPYFDPMLNVNGKQEPVKGYITDILSDRALDFIGKQRERPFCLYLSHKAVHGPFTPAPRHEKLYEGAKPSVRPSASDPLEGKPAVLANRPKAAARPSAPPEGRPIRGSKVQLGQMQALAAVDEGVGRILKALEESGKLDSTIIIFAGDNGYFWGEHGLGDKRWAYEDSIRIPLLVRYPKLIKAGSLPKQLALNIDIAPTLLELAGAKPEPKMQGKSLCSLLKGETSSWRKDFFAEYFKEAGFPNHPSWISVRTETSKYITYPGHPDWDELYDLARDPFGDEEPRLRQRARSRSCEAESASGAAEEANRL